MAIMTAQLHDAKTALAELERRDWLGESSMDEVRQVLKALVSWCECMEKGILNR